MTNGYEMMHKAWSIIEDVPYSFSRSSVKFQGHTGQKIANFDQNWAFPEFEFTDGYEMMQKAWSSIEEVPYCISKSSVKFQGRTGQKKIVDFDQNRVFPDRNSRFNWLMDMK